MSEKKPEVSIVVSNWNGMAFIEPCLDTLWKSAEASGIPFELIVVDDVSSDGSVDFIRERFPGVRLLINQKNVGFARTCNRGAEAAQGRVLVMMNNDMKVPVEFIAHLVAPFFRETPRGSPPLFCVGAKTVQWDDGTPNHLCMDGAWRRGGLGSEWYDPPERVETVYAQGGSAAFDLEMFLELGGFDPFFYPTYWDDYDLCYRACKIGWRVLYEPLAVADHLGKATLTRQHGRSRLAQIMERNRLWFTWLNLDDPGLWCRHIAALPWVYGRDLIRGEGPNGLLGFGRALGGAFRVMRHRRERRNGEAAEAVRSDRDLLHLQN